MVRPDRITDLTFNATSLWLVVKHAAETQVFEFEAGSSRAVTVGAAEHANVRLKLFDAPPIACYFEREGDDVWLVPAYRSETLRADTTVVDKPRKVWGRCLVELPGFALEVKVREEPPTYSQIEPATDFAVNDRAAKARPAVAPCVLKEQDLVCGGLAMIDVEEENLTVPLPSQRRTSSAPPPGNSQAMAGTHETNWQYPLSATDEYCSPSVLGRTAPFGIPRERTAALPPAELHQTLSYGGRHISQPSPAPTQSSVGGERQALSIEAHKLEASSSVHRPAATFSLPVSAADKLPRADEIREYMPQSGGSLAAVAKPSVRPLASLGELTTKRPLLVAVGATAGSFILVVLMLAVARIATGPSPRASSASAHPLPRDVGGPVIHAESPDFHISAVAAPSTHENVPSEALPAATTVPATSAKKQPTRVPSKAPTMPAAAQNNPSSGTAVGGSPSKTIAEGGAKPPAAKAAPSGMAW